MKTSRILLGLALLFFAAFSVFARTCGMIGELLIHLQSHLLGPTGSFLVTTTAFVAGVLCFIPLRSWVRGVSAIDRRISVARRERARLRREEARLLREEIRLAQAEEARAAAQERRDRMQASGEIKTAAAPKLIPSERLKLDEVRGALKSLGYKENEYDMLVKAMDPTLPLERLVKDGLRVLSAPRN